MESDEGGIQITGILEPKHHEVKFQSRTKEILTRPFRNVYEHFKSTPTVEYKMGLKGAFAFAIASLFAFIEPLRSPYGSTFFLIPIAIAFFDFSSSIGVMMQTVISICIAVGFSVPAAMLTMLLALHSEPGTIGVLFVISYVYSFARAEYPKFYLGTILGIFNVVIATVTAFFLQTWSITVVKDFVISTFTGAGIAVVVNSILFPVTTLDLMKTQLQTTLLNINSNLELSSQIFLMEHETQGSQNIIDQAVQQTTQLFQKLGVLQNQIKYELHYSVFSHKSIISLAKSAKKCTHYLALLVTSRMIRAPELREPVKELVAPLKPSLMNVVEASNFNINIIIKAIKTENVVPLSNLRDIKPIFKNFFDMHNQVSNQIKLDDTMKVEFLIHLSFFVFTLERFVEELIALEECLRSVGCHKRLHFPRRIASTFERFTVKDVCTQQAKMTTEKKRTLAKTLWYRIKKKFTSMESKFGIKTAIAICISITPMFFVNFGDIFYEWRGQWVVLSVVATSQPFFGEAWLTSVHRIVGTGVGSLCAAVVWTIGGRNFTVVYPLTIVYALVMFHIKQTTSLVRLASVAIFTYVVILFGKWQPDFGAVTYSVWTLAYRRAIGVSLGVIVATIINRLLWPVFRDHLRIQIATIVRDLAVLFGRNMVLVFKEDRSSVDAELSALESTIQSGIIKSRYLATTVRFEPGNHQFPIADYTILLNACQKLLDQMIVLKSIGSLQEPVKQALIYPVTVQRREMVKRVLLLFYIISGALLSRTPLPYMLPDALGARDKLVAAASSLPAAREGRLTNDQLLHYYVYAIFVREVILEAHMMADTVRDLYGTDEYARDIFEFPAT